VPRAAFTQVRAPLLIGAAPLLLAAGALVLVERRTAGA
jgi:hypothetical protein